MWHVTFLQGHVRQNKRVPRNVCATYLSRPVQDSVITSTDRWIDDNKVIPLCQPAYKGNTKRCAMLNVNQTE